LRLHDDAARAAIAGGGSSSSRGAATRLAGAPRLAIVFRIAVRLALRGR
jgi:hypothetical protein